MPRLRLVLAAAALCWLPPAEGKRSSGRDRIWGSCGCHGGSWGNQGNTASCQLLDATCADRLSDGPADADIEVTLGNLPPSTPAEEVHLHWWAPYRSVHDYDPLSGPGGSSIYNSMCEAYPNYWSAGFNGGNVRVDESGAAVVRVRRPSTYYNRPHLSYPHVHFRVCRGNASAQIYHDKLAIEPDGLVMHTKSQDTEITIVSQMEYAGASAQDDYDIPDPDDRWPTTTTSPVSTTMASTPALTTTAAIGSSAPASTTTATTVTTGTQQGLAGLFDAAKAELLLDALEFSPVYECLSDQLLFDHFSGECADQCPGDADLHAGQCVVPKQEGASSGVLLTASWQLAVHCEDLCGKNMEMETLHNIRLGVAGHLDIPFQEVEQAALIWTTGSSDRRLNGSTQVSLVVKVMTERYDEGVGMTRLEAFLDNLGHASQLLGMVVAEAALLPDSEDADASDSATWTITSDNDPYTLAYDALLSPGGEKADPQANKNGLSDLLAIGVVAGAIVCGVALGLMVWKLRQWRRKSHPDLTPPEMVAGTPYENKVDVETVDSEKGATSEPKLP